MPSDKSPLREFFKRYSPGFQYDPLQPANTEFHRLSIHKGWVSKTPSVKVEKKKLHNAGKKAQLKFKDALIEQFNQNYGKDEESLAGWQALCATVRIKPVPSTLEEAKRAFNRVHVNLIDLTEGYNNGRPVQLFNTVQKLSNYTKENGSYFPKDRAKAGGLLRCLLRQINDLHLSRRGRGRRSASARASSMDLDVY